jgi:uncharacterized protein (TIGR02611 family)
VVSAALNGDTPPADTTLEDFSPAAKERFVRLRRLHARAHSNPVTSLITKVVVTIVGVFLILIGIVMLVGPGQGILAILAGLAVLATEYAWAERLLRRVQARIHEAREKARAMDPKVRRRRIILSTLATVAAVGAVVAYLVVYDWPTIAVSSWNWLQNFSSLVPELPGM